MSKVIHNTMRIITGFLLNLRLKLFLKAKSEKPKYKNPANFVIVKKLETPNGSQYSNGNEKTNSNKVNIFIL